MGVVGEHNNAALVLFMGSCGSLSMAGGLKLWHFSAIIDPRRKIQPQTSRNR